MYVEIFSRKKNYLKCGLCLCWRDKITKTALPSERNQTVMPKKIVHSLMTTSLYSVFSISKLHVYCISQSHFITAPSAAVIFHWWLRQMLYNYKQETTDYPIYFRNVPISDKSLTTNWCYLWQQKRLARQEKICNSALSSYGIKFSVCSEQEK